MKTPDKIYIYMASPCDNHYSITTTDNITDMKYEVEYIRKDALLKWAKDLKHIYEIPVNNHQASKLCCAKAEAIQNVINKINSL